METERAGDDLDFAADTGVVEAGAATDDRLGRTCSQRTQERGGGRAVRDAHLADADERRAVAREIAGDVDAHFEGARGFIRGHRGTVEEVAGAGADAAIGHAIE